ncbi:MAG: CopG family transcriptional regulator [Gammaproteobacteria bacterium]|jgi:plasmid stability protein|nr:CopG family transcriptional regulator [Gammaproteobacteria bacterium]MDP6094646.1 CopG family transcriptional regulator [Gammaproteobacteria bacterium]HJO12215.1 CopG family transcriptional regulator [Gammaproteobacteria bacterium]|tara:strand:+ start:973 stop:1206 length:234 start_codon:yes stop_codon:yes gene_type:complete
MTELSKRSTIYFNAELHAALRIKAAHSQKSISDLVNEAVRLTLSEDQEDLATFEDRSNEGTISYETLLNDLRANGKL